MSEKQEKILKLYCAHVLVKYGFEFTPHDPVIPALYTIYRELNSNKTGNEEVARSIKDALGKLNPTVYNFSERGEAWKFKMAESLRWLFVGLSVVLVIFLSFIWWRQYNNVQKASVILTTSKGVEEIFIKSAHKDNAGYVYLEFARAKNGTVDFWTQYDEVREDTVRVYVGKIE